MYCTECGVEVSPDSRFCNSCGAKQTIESEDPAPRKVADSHGNEVLNDKVGRLLGDDKSVINTVVDKLKIYTKFSVSAKHCAECDYNGIMGFVGNEISMDLVFKATVAVSALMILGGVVSERYLSCIVGMAILLLERQRKTSAKFECPKCGGIYKSKLPFLALLSGNNLDVVGK